MRATLLVALLVPCTAMSGCSVCDFASDCYTFFGVFATRDYLGDVTVDETADALQEIGYRVVAKDVSFVQAFSDDSTTTIYVRGFSAAPGPVGYEPPKDGSIRLCVHYHDWTQIREKEALEHKANALQDERATHAKNLIAALEANIHLTPTTTTSWETAVHPKEPEAKVHCY